MGLFGKSKKELLRWQKVVISDSPDKLIATEKQLRLITNQQASNDIRILNDCKKLILETSKPDVFFSRLALMEEKINDLEALAPYIKINVPVPKLKSEFLADKQNCIGEFLKRYFQTVIDKMVSSKTEKGKKNQIQKFYDSLKEYYDQMDSANKEFVETKYSVYMQ